MTGIKTVFKRTGSFLNQHSPQILVVAGIVMGVAATVMACVATIKAQPKIEEFRKDLVDIHEKMNEKSIEKKDGKKELVKTYKTVGLEVVKHYAVPVGLTVGSVGCTLSGFGILNKRFAGVSLALGSATASLDRIYKRLEEDLGEEKAKNYIYGLKDVTIKDTETDPETGEVKKVKKTIKVRAEEELEPFEVEFNGGPNYERDVNYNYMFVKAQESLAQRDHDIYKTPMFLDEILGKNYLNLPVEGERLQKMMHHIGWPVGVTPSFGPEVVYDIDEEGVRTAKLMLHFTGLSGNPWSKENK